MCRWMPVVLTALWVVFTSPILLRACPFCTSVALTFTEEMEGKQVVVLATLEQPPDVIDDTDPNAPLPKAKFRVREVLKGSEWVSADTIFEVVYFGEANQDRTYLAMGVDPPNLMWGTPLGLSAQAKEYILKLPSLPADPSRLEFFQEYLEAEDEMLSRDAYDEFAKTPYAGVIALKDKMHHDRLISWIKNPDVPASRKRLYFTMLGICGTPADAPLLAEMMQSEDRRQKAGLDAMLACYLLLTKEAGLLEVERLFLANANAEYADTYAAIMAIRFHGTETNVLEKTRLVKSLRHLLDRPELADLVIPDLAKWQDWEVMPRLVQLFKDADEKSSWVRVPVINYLRSCPLPEAQQQIEELAKIDPEAVKRAQTFFPFDSTEPGTNTPAAEQPAPAQPAVPQPSENSSATTQPAPPAPDELGGGQALTAAESYGSEPSAQVAVPPASAAIVPGVEDTEPQAEIVPPHRENDNTAALTAESGQAPEDSSHAAAAAPVRQSSSRSSDAAASLRRRNLVGDSTWVPNRAQLWGVPIAAGIVLLFTYRIVLGVPWRGVAG